MPRKCMGVWEGSSTHSLGAGYVYGQLHAPAALTPENDPPPVTITQKAGWVPETV
jgi:hypothetical protein